MTAPRITPTVGRVLLFFTNGCSINQRQTDQPHVFVSDFAQPDPGQPCAAIIARVWSEGMVNLAVFDANGDAHAVTSVALVQPDDPKPQFGYYCTWMPYQVGQAARTEKAEAKSEDLCERRARAEIEEIEARTDYHRACAEAARRPSCYGPSVARASSGEGGADVPG